MYPLKLGDVLCNTSFYNYVSKYELKWRIFRSTSHIGRGPAKGCDRRQNL